MGECKAKPIQTNLGTFMHNKTYSGTIQAYSGIFRTLYYPDIFKTLVYPEPWHLQNQNHIQNPGILTTLLYSELHYIHNAGIFRTVYHIYSEAVLVFTVITIFTNYNYFRKAYRVEINIWR